MAPRIDTAPRDVETPTWFSYSQRHPGRIRSYPRITNPCINLQLQQAGGENGCPTGRYRPPRCGKPNLGFVDPMPPGEDKITSPDYKSFNTSTTPTNQGCER